MSDALDACGAPTGGAGRPLRAVARPARRPCSFHARWATRVMLEQLTWLMSFFFAERSPAASNQRRRRCLPRRATVHARSSRLTEAWTAGRLLRLSARQLPVPEWFNRSAPAIKLGHYRPGRAGRTPGPVAAAREPAADLAR